MTTLRSLPRDWTLARFGEIADFRNGINFTHGGAGKPIRIVGVADFWQRSTIRAADILSWIEPNGDLSTENLLRDGDLLFVRSNGNKALIGRCVSVHPGLEQVTFSGFTIRARLSTNVTSPEYLARVLQSSLFKRQLHSAGGGTNISNLGQDALASFVLPLPPLPEQRRIADVLATWDYTIERLSRQVSRKNEAFAYLREALVLGTRRLNRRSKPWPIVALGALGDFVKGCGLTKADMAESGVPCLRYAEIYTSYGEVTVALQSRATTGAAEAALPLLRDDIVFAASGETAEEIGKAVGYLGQGEAVVGGDTIVFRNHGQNTSFLARALNCIEIQKQKSRLGHGHSVVHIHASSLAEIKIGLPSSGEQGDIVEVLDDAEQEIDALKAERIALAKQRDALTTQLLTGRRRVSDAAEAASVAG